MRSPGQRHVSVSWSSSGDAARCHCDTANMEAKVRITTAAEAVPTIARMAMMSKASRISLGETAGTPCKTMMGDFPKHLAKC
jgi:hypothetical protein